MDIQNILTYAIEAIAFSFVALLIVDLGNRVTYEFLDILCPIAPTPGVQKELPYASAYKAEASPCRFEIDMQQKSMGNIDILDGNQQTSDVEDFCLAEVDLAGLPSTQLRKLCSERGIKWRNAYGGKHLTKMDMIAALSS
jgi:hypothetical protein